MARCPECQTEQNADFGMTTCPQCSAVFMVGIDGEVESVEPAPIEDHIQNESGATVVEAFEASGNAASDDEATNHAEEQNEAEAAYSAETDEADKINVSKTEYSENFLDNLSDNPQVATESELESSADPLGIQRFDQSAASQMRDGEYLYEVVITGIDSADLKREVLMALSEKRFSLIISELQKEIQKGELIVRNLNPVRAMLIVLRLQSLDITIEWRQKHFTQGKAVKENEAEV